MAFCRCLPAIFTNNAIVQASKAIDYFENNSKEFIFSWQHIELQRLFLISTLQNKAARKELANIGSNTISKFGKQNSGSVFIKKISFPGKKCENDKKNTTWYICVVTCGNEVYGTSAAKANEDGHVLFENEFKVMPRSSNFELTIALYGMRTIIRKTKTLARNNCSCNNFQVLTDIRKPAFELYAKTIIRIQDIKKTEFCMRQCSPYNKHYMFLYASLTALPNLFERLEGFLNIGKQTSDGEIVWNRLWCSLQQNLLKFYSFPNHEEENNYLDMIELNKCTSQAYKGNRPRTLLLEFLDENENNRKVNIIYLSADTVEDMEFWEDAINRVFNTLVSWHCLNE